MEDIYLEIPLPPVTKKNSQRIVMRWGRPIVLPSEKFTQYEKTAGFYLKHKGEKINRPCTVKALFFMQTRRVVDLTNLLEALDDVLVAYGVLQDDNSNIIVSHDGSRVMYDKKNPRTEVTIIFWEEEHGTEELG